MNLPLDTDLHLDLYLQSINVPRSIREQILLHVNTSYLIPLKAENFTLIQKVKEYESIIAKHFINA